MDKHLQIVILEDNASDAELVRRELHKAGLNFTARVAPDKAAYLQALDAGPWDLILADYSLPGFDGLTAVSLARQRLGDVPAVIVSGAIGEETAIEALKAGATDYVLKQRLNRLGPVVKRALQEAEQLAEKRRAQTELARQREWLKVTLTSIGDAVIASDTSGRITFLNPVAAGLTGWTQEDAAGQPVGAVFAVINEKTRQPAEDVVARVLRDKCVVALANDTALVAKDGREIPVEDSAAPIVDTAGEILGVVLVFHDVTLKRQTQKALQESEERFRLLMDGVKDHAIFMLDPEGRVAMWNAGAQQVKGYAAQEILGRSFSQFYAPEDVATGKPQAELAIATQRGQYAEEGWRVRKDGSRFWAAITITALRDATGQLRGFAKLTHDTTQRMRAEETLRRTAEELARSNADLEQFAYVASHDLQEPLRAVTGFVQLLQQQYVNQLDAKANGLIEYAIEGAKRMQTLIADLLTYSRVGSRGREPKPTDTSDVLQRALGNLAASIKESAAEITHGDLPTVRADETQLIQLFQNLLGNAIKFRGPEAPKIHVEARRNHDHWLFSVRDNGIGINPEFGDRIFMIFQRLHTRKKYPGTGIGLAICKKIVERHGGQIWMESQPGQGATFHFTLPG